MKKIPLSKILLPLLALFCLSPWVSAGMALVLGILFALFLGNPYQATIKKITHQLLGLSVMGLGAGMNLGVVAQVGLQGVGYTVLGIATALGLGILLGRWFKMEGDTATLISVGTAICGGSAIAAVAPVLKAKHEEVSVSLGIVFLLNALALFIFPAIGHHFVLSESQFGLWSALAIHDTSSVVGATLQYGPHALEVGTTVKLARALWIIPVAFFFGYLHSRKYKNAEEVKTETAKKPWFILGFILMAALVTWIPRLQPLGHQVEILAKHMLVLTLFLIGTQLTVTAIKSVGVKAFAQGVLLWLFMASASFAAIYAGFVHL